MEAHKQPLFKYCMRLNRFIVHYMSLVAFNKTILLKRKSWLHFFRCVLPSQQTSTLAVAKATVLRLMLPLQHSTQDFKVSRPGHVRAVAQKVTFLQLSHFVRPQNAQITFPPLPKTALTCYLAGCYYLGPQFYFNDPKVSAPQSTVGLHLLFTLHPDIKSTWPN